MNGPESNRTECHRARIGVLKDFIAALADPYTYSLRRNPEVLFGFLWGIPIPIFAVLTHAHGAGGTFDPSQWINIMCCHPVYIFFYLHPFVFAVIFGALGTIRAHRERHIRLLLQQVEQHCQELFKANARLTELDRYKSEFLANVTHELKSPLVTALGYTDRVLGGHLGEINERQQKGLEVGKRNLHRLRKLIDEILDFSRLDAGVSKFEMARTDLAAAVHTAVEGLTLKAKERNISIVVSVPPNPSLVVGDRGKLSQVVINLLDNAVKFSREGGTINVSITSNGPCWRLTVADTGVGISPKVLPQLFERFVQEDGSLSRNYDGVGLGLVIVKKIAEAHGGRVWIESQLGAGTTVFVEVPACQEPDKLTTVNSRKETAHA